MHIVLTIIITFIATFIITAGWQLLASKKNRKQHLLITSAIIRELDDMSKKLGYEDYYSYHQSFMDKGA